MGPGDWAFFLKVAARYGYQALFFRCINTPWGSPKDPSRTPVLQSHYGHLPA